jgi:hypothetical protein
LLHTNTAIAAIPAPTASLSQFLLWPTNPQYTNTATAIIVATPSPPQSLRQHCRHRQNHCTNTATAIIVPTPPLLHANSAIAAIPAPTASPPQSLL